MPHLRQHVRRQGHHGSRRQHARFREGQRNTGDARESPSQPIARKLVELGADVQAADPHVIDRHVPAGVTRVQLDEQVLREADAVVLLVDHDEFDLDLVASTAGYVLDTRHCIQGDTVEHL